MLPVTAKLVMVKALLPLLARVIVWAVLVVPTDWLAKERLVAGRLTAGGMAVSASGGVPVPERLTLWGLPLALSTTLTVAVRAPLAEGVKVTRIVQVAPAATELPQLVVGIRTRDGEAGDRQRSRCRC